MATYIMFGKYSLEAMRAISAKRSEEAIALIREYGGEVKEVYALLGDTDLLVIVDLPNAEQALKTSLALSKLLGISFSTMPAMSVEQLDKLVE